MTHFARNPTVEDVLLADGRWYAVALTAERESSWDVSLEDDPPCFEFVEETKPTKHITGPLSAVLAIRFG